MGQEDGEQCYRRSRGPICMDACIDKQRRTWIFRIRGRSSDFEYVGKGGSEVGGRGTEEAITNGGVCVEPFEWTGAYA
eukprot:1020823-Pelagomonas_calceolata.AAC.2